MLTLKLGNNLHICNNQVISYYTVVATIAADQIIVHGKWSRTTTKHLNEVARVTRSSLVQEKRVCDTDWLPYGVNVKLTDSLSVKSSLLIASKLNHTFGMIGAIASNWDKINKKDKNLIYEELRADDEFRMMIQLVEDNFPL